MTGERADEPPIDPDLPIVDPHQHFWEIMPAPGSMHVAQRFLLHEMLATIERSGHNVVQTVAVECNAMYRADGDDALKPVGEVEFCNGMAAMSASGNYGPRRLAAGIVGSANLMLGDAVAPVLDAEIAAAGGRLRGIRFHSAYSEAGMFGMPCDPGTAHSMLQPQYRDSARVLARMGLTLDVWCFHTQLAELVDLATHCPELSIVLDHVGTLESQGGYVGREAEAFAEWKSHIVELARRPNVVVKLGGMGMDLSGPIGAHFDNAPSERLADKWRPRIETCIEAFGPDRCMFESNFPPDNAAGSYGATWNAFKRVTSGCSDTEKALLFAGTARRIYRLD